MSNTRTETRRKALKDLMDKHKSPELEELYQESEQSAENEKDMEKYRKQQKILEKKLKDLDKMFEPKHKINPKIKINKK